MPTPPTPTLEVFVGGSSEVLHVRSRDGNGALSNLTAFSTDSSELIHVHAAGGTWTATLNGHTTSAIAIGALAADVEDALEALTGVGEGQCVVSGDGPDRLVQWTGTLAGTVVPLLSFGTGSLLASGTAPALTAGSTAVQAVDSTIGGHFAQVGTWSGAANNWSASAAGTGLAQAEWTVAGLATGWYQLSWSFGTQGSTLSTSTPYRAFDGTAPRALAVVNQQAQPQQSNLAGVDCQPFASAFVTGGNALRVLVTDAVAGGDVGKLIGVSRLIINPIDPTKLTIDSGGSTPGNTYLPTVWSGLAQGFNNQLHFSMVAGETLTILFAGIPNGSYQFQHTWVSAGNRSMAVPYAMYDGATLLGTTTKNQQADPAGGLTISGFAFAILGTFNVTSGNASIVITVPVGGNYATTCAALLSLQSAAAYSETISATGAVFAGGPPTITVNGGAPVTLTSTPNFDPGVAGVGVAPLMSFPLGFTLSPTDVVAFTAPANALACAAGSIPAITSQAVTNCSGRSLGPDVPGTITMKVGHNLLSSGAVPFSSNLFLNQQPLPFTDTNPGTSLGYPQSVTATQYFFNLGTEPANAVDPKSYPGLLQGLYKITWDGATGGEIHPAPVTGTTMAFVGINTGHATGNMVQFSLSIADPATYYAPAFTAYFYLNQGFADDADTGRCSSTGAWNAGTASTSWNGGYHLSDTSPSSVWTWTLGHLPGGTYKFAGYWKGLAGNTTQARYTVRQDGTELIHWDVDQTADAAPFSDMQGSDLNGNSFYFRPNGQSALTTGGNITIDLHTVNGDGHAMADAVGYVLSGSLTSGTPFAPIASAVCLGPETSSL